MITEVAAVKSLENLALMMKLTPSQAVALPAVIDRSANSVGLNRRQMISQCYANADLCSYLASVCVQVTV